MKRSKPFASLPQILTVQEVSEYLRIHRTTVYRLVRAKQLPAFQVGSDWRFDLDSIDRWSRGESKRQ